MSVENGILCDRSEKTWTRRNSVAENSIDLTGEITRVELSNY